MNNSAEGEGGVMYTSESSFSITNSTFTNNHVAVIVVESCPHLNPLSILPKALLLTALQLMLVESCTYRNPHALNICYVTALLLTTVQVSMVINYGLFTILCTVHADVSHVYRRVPVQCASIYTNLLFARHGEAWGRGYVVTISGGCRI